MASPRYLRTMDDRTDQWVFFSAVIIGLILIIGARWIFKDINSVGISWTNFIPVLIAVAVITLYVVYIRLSTDRTSISVDRAGDNAYYIGLIFTLVSLCVSLVYLSFQDLLGAKRVLSLLPDFGVALISTIWGIGARIYVQQYRNDPADIEGQARYELGIAVRELQTTLLTAVSDIRNTSTATNIAMTDMVGHINETLEESVEQSSTAVSRVAENMEILAAQCAAQVTAMANISKDLAEQVRLAGHQLREQVGGLDIDTAPASEKLFQFTTELERTIQQIPKITILLIEAAERLTSTFPITLTSDLQIKGNKALIGLNSLFDQMEKLEAEIEGRRRRMGEFTINSRLENLGEETITQQELFTTELETLTKTLTTLRTDLSRINIDESLRDSREETQKQQSQLNQSQLNLNILDTEIRDLRTFIGQLSNSEVVLSEYITALTDSIRKIREASENI